MYARYLLSGILSNASVWYFNHKRQREYWSNHDFQERSFACSGDEIELRNKPMTYQISNVDLSAVSVSIGKRSDDVAILSMHAEPR